MHPNLHRLKYACCWPMLALVLTGSAWGQTAEEASHQRMIQRLQQISADTARHPYLGDRAVRQLRQVWERRPRRGATKEMWQVSSQLGYSELKLGNVAAAIDLLNTAWQLANEVVLEPSEEETTLFFLGVAYLRLGEVENCCLRHNADSCIMPIQGGGVHAKQEGSRQAIQHFADLIDRFPRTKKGLSARWLLNIAYMTLGTYPDDVPAKYLIKGLDSSRTDSRRFKNIAGQRGIDTFDLAGGTIVEDFDNDGLLDLVTSSWDSSAPMHYFRNVGEGKFEDMSASSRVSQLTGGLNICQADYDNDGNVDIVVFRGAWTGKFGRQPNSLIRNNGDGTFTDVSYAAGIAEPEYPTQTGAWADYDNDGDLDLFVGNEHSAEIEAPCQLFNNQGDGTFKDVAAAAGVRNMRFTKGVTWGDFNNDGFVDLYLSNLGESNRLYRNNGDGTFEDVASQIGVTEPKVSFPTWFWDYDNDGKLDLLVLSYSGGEYAQAAHHLGLSHPFGASRLFKGDGERFVDVTRQAGLDMPMQVMGCNFGDLDNDGNLDVYLGTGQPSYAALMPNLMFLNQGGRFKNITFESGFGHLQKGHAVAFADFDQDGDNDVFEQMGGAYPGDKYNNALFQNPGNDNHWISLKLEGTQSNRSAIGARIKIMLVVDGKPRSVFRHVNTGGSFGANPLRQHIGLGAADRIDRLVIRWPATGEKQVFEGIPADQFLRITEGTAELQVASPRR